MPQIIVTADRATDTGGAPVMFRERVSARDFESRHFADQLTERLGWAVGDAEAVETDPLQARSDSVDEPVTASEPEPQLVEEAEPMPMVGLIPVVPQAW